MFHTLHRKDTANGMYNIHVLRNRNMHAKEGVSKKGKTLRFCHTIVILSHFIVNDGKIT